MGFGPDRCDVGRSPIDDAADPILRGLRASETKPVCLLTGSVVLEDCELGFLSKTGRFFAFAVDATNFFVAAGAFFFGGEMLGTRISRPGVTVLPEDGISFWSFSSCSSPDTWGETNRAVGRVPDVEDTLGFFRMGCGGGGLRALDGMSLERQASDLLCVLSLGLRPSCLSLGARSPCLFSNKA